MTEYKSKFHVNIQELQAHYQLTEVQIITFNYRFIETANLPSWIFGVSVVGKIILNPLVNFTQCHPLVGLRRQGHLDQLRIRKRRSSISIPLLLIFCHLISKKTNINFNRLWLKHENTAYWIIFIIWFNWFIRLLY